MFMHQVIGGRLYLFDPQVMDDITQGEVAWGARDAQRRPQASYRWGLDRLGPPSPPVAIEFQGFTPGHPSPSNVYGLPQSDRQEQLLRIQNAQSLFEERPQALLRASGTVWVVDGNRVFVAEGDAELSGAVAVRRKSVV